MKTFKEVLKGVLVTIIILAIAGGVGTYETHYNKQMFVYSIEGNEVVLEDSKGEQWVWEDSEHTFEEEEIVVVTMFTNYTDNTIYDDEIVRIKKKQ